MSTDKTLLKNESQPSCLGAVRRSFNVGDLVVYKPYEGCSHKDISNYGKVLEDLGNGDYKITFGYKSIHGLRTGKYNYSNLWAI